MNKMGNCKLVIYSIIILQLLNLTSIWNIRPLFNELDDSYILISNKGKISLKERNNEIIWETLLDQQLISTYINVKQINFDKMNVLPGDDGRLYVIQPQQEKYTVFNFSIKDLVGISPNSLPFFDHKVFRGTKDRNKYYVNMHNGMIALEEEHMKKKGFANDIGSMCQMNIIIQRNDYKLELYNNEESVVEWNATLSLLELTTTDHELYDHRDTLNLIDWNILELNRKEYQYIYKYEGSTGNLIKMTMDYLDQNTAEVTLDYYSKSENSYIFSSYVINGLLAILAVGLMIIFKLRRRIQVKVVIPKIEMSAEVKERASIESHHNNLKEEVEADDLLKQKRHSNQEKEKQNHDSFSNDSSQLSTRSVMNKSIDEMHRRFSQSFNPQITTQFLHRASAPDETFTLNPSKAEENQMTTDEKNLIIHEETQGNDEQLSVNVVYQMKKIEKNHVTMEKPKSAPPIQALSFLKQCNQKNPRKTSEYLHAPKKKYMPTIEEKDELQLQITQYITNINNSSTDSLCKEGDSITKKQNEIYKIINRTISSCSGEERNSNSNNYDNNDSSRNNNNKNYDITIEKSHGRSLILKCKSHLSNDIFKSPNLSLCDSGRFINTFDNIQIIGKGGFGSVFKGIHKIDGSNYAIKVIKFYIGFNEDLSKINEVKEVKTMMKLDHSNIVRYITCWFEFEDLNMLNKRARSLSMDEPQNNNNGDNRCLVKKSTKMLQNLYNDNNNYHNSEFELVIQETYKGNFKKDCNTYSDHSIIIDDDDIDDNNSYSNVDVIFEDEHSKCMNNVQFGDNDLNNQYNNINTYDDGNSDDDFLAHDKTQKKNLNYKDIDKCSDNAVYKRSAKRKKTETKILFPVYFFMQMEYCEGFNLSYYLNMQQKPLPRKLIVHFLSQLANAVELIHDKSIIHRDLKPANIFVKQNFKLKIGDFGLAAEMKQYSSKETVGTFLYQSPEQLAGKTYNEKVDIYALGLILLEMCSHFGTESERRSVLMNVRKAVYPTELKELYPNEYDLVKEMTQNNPVNRPSIQNIIDSIKMIELTDMI